MWLIKNNLIFYDGLGLGLGLLGLGFVTDNHHYTNQMNVLAFIPTMR
jgi:hypothetical protein